MIEIAPARAAVLLLFLAGLFDGASAQPAPLNAKVVWVRDERVYIASPDSVALEQGIVLTFRSRGKTMATGEVARVHGEVAVAKLTSGSLKSVKKLERLQILSERPALRALPLMRIGYPGRGRSNLLFFCDPVTLRSPNGYRTDMLSELAYRLVREPGNRLQGPWPDTLLVRFFGEAADEEIALERGELDMAVFWPGELSSYMREHPLWRDFLLGIRSRGVVGAIWYGWDGPGDLIVLSPSDSLALASLNHELFRGELAPWADAVGWVALPDSLSSFRQSGSTHFIVPDWPGQERIQRLLNRGSRVQAAQDRSRLASLFYLDSPIHALDSLCLDIADYVRRSASGGPRARADSLEAEIRRLKAAGLPLASDGVRRYLRDWLHVTFHFAIRCPVVCDPRLRPYVSALGSDAVVNMLGCRPTGHQP